MSNKKYDMIVYVGRFQPFHVAHEYTINEALKLADKVLVLIGSSVAPRTIKNPFTFGERKTMIHRSFNEFDQHRILFSGIPDYDYDDQAWIAKIGETVAERSTVGSEKIAFIGHDKDHSSFYLNYFPQYDFIPMGKFPTPDGSVLNATDIRNSWFDASFDKYERMLPQRVFQLLGDIYQDNKNEWFENLLQEYKYIQDYKRSWENTPYPAPFITVDAVVVQSGHILLVERGGFPCKGQWAMAGGFIEPHETLNTAVIRELIEETQIKLPQKMLERIVLNAPNKLFDKPDRSARGRTFTQAYLIQLNDDEKLPRVIGSDDAKKAQWIPISDFKNMQNVMFEDHYAIINKMLTKLK